MISTAGSRSSTGGQALSGLALLRKPVGITSFQALNPIKRSVSSGRVGHAGTLDRFASGLLVILIGSYSRLASYVVAGKKHYRGLIAFGAETSTLDPEGEVLYQAPGPTRAALIDVLPSFRGPILQVPPIYSAIHVGGKRAYKLAREGKEPELKERAVEIFSLELLSCEEGDFPAPLAAGLLAASRRWKLPARVHADASSPSRGWSTAVAGGAVGADHLTCTPDEEIRAVGATRWISPETMVPCPKSGGTFAVSRMATVD